MAKLVNDTKVVTNTVRFEKVAVSRPANASSDEYVYRIELVIEKGDKETLSCIRQAVAAAKAEGKRHKWNGRTPARLKLALRDGDIERPSDEAYRNSYFITASSLQAPFIIDTFLEPITDETALHNGCHGRASITFFPYKAGKLKGVGVKLNHLQKLDEPPQSLKQCA